MTWWERALRALGRGIWVALVAILELLRDMLAEIGTQAWAALRRIIVRNAPWVVGGGALILFAVADPKGFEVLLQGILVIAIMLYGVKVMVRGIFPPPKKKKRGH